ncbi:SapB/AmfS family lantipeptide [Nocardiopsis ganjiahuensis]|nr:SapB/AmfS family lantipeptide [Nocardiopsis ganjiahuensis]
MTVNDVLDLQSLEDGHRADEGEFLNSGASLVSCS